MLPLLLYPATCSVRSQLYLFTAAVDRHGKKTVLLYIFAKTIEKKEQGLDTSVTEETFLNELKKKAMKKLISEKKMS